MEHEIASTRSSTKDLEWNDASSPGGKRDVVKQSSYQNVNKEFMTSCFTSSSSLTRVSSLRRSSPHHEGNFRPSQERVRIALLQHRCIMSKPHLKSKPATSGAPLRPPKQTHLSDMDIAELNSNPTTQFRLLALAVGFTRCVTIHRLHDVFLPTEPAEPATHL